MRAVILSNMTGSRRPSRLMTCMLVVCLRRGERAAVVRQVAALTQAERGAGAAMVQGQGSRARVASLRAPVKAGRLTIEDLMWLYDIIDEVKDDLTSYHKPR